MQKTRIMMFGTFDGLHKGHLNMFRQAKVLAPNSFTIVLVARDLNIKKIKGLLPTLNEKKRLGIIKACKLVDKAILGSKTDFCAQIKKENPDFIALGYDHKISILELKKSLKNKKISPKIVRLKPYKKNIYKNHLLKNKRRLK